MLKSYLPSIQRWCSIPGNCIETASLKIRVSMLSALDAADFNQEPPSLASAALAHSHDNPWHALEPPIGLDMQVFGARNAGIRPSRSNTPLSKYTAERPRALEVGIERVEPIGVHKLPVRSSEPSGTHLACSASLPVPRAMLNTHLTRSKRMGHPRGYHRSTTSPGMRDVTQAKVARVPLRGSERRTRLRSSSPSAAPTSDPARRRKPHTAAFCGQG
ncbi:hypothetical protein AURDEDRAFT_114306 [Auricularia subglabra TFB-10046 SS5]|uniref:Uncharacterized protein n=1 Tax=Auricularia subglabra (strain TFB-10046 / SS5) TaxID=717982 RepID=J0WZ93_AURST|nr:hypothetical protein AURDEDRAFT_114306 [Auricularia subglabra TFB-10046 SS5]